MSHADALAHHTGRSHTHTVACRSSRHATPHGLTDRLSLDLSLVTVSRDRLSLARLTSAHGFTYKYSVPPAATGVGPLSVSMPITALSMLALPTHPAAPSPVLVDTMRRRSASRCTCQGTSQQISPLQDAHSALSFLEAFGALISRNIRSRTPWYIARCTAERCSEPTPLSTMRWN